MELSFPEPDVPLGPELGWEGGVHRIVHGSVHRHPRFGMEWCLAEASAGLLTALVRQEQGLSQGHRIGVHSNRTRNVSLGTNISGFGNSNQWAHEAMTVSFRSRAKAAWYSSVRARHVDAGRKAEVELAVPFAAKGRGSSRCPALGVGCPRWPDQQRRRRRCSNEDAGYPQTSLHYCDRLFRDSWGPTKRLEGP